ncbi:beta-galactosidase, partial [bacterium]|nr:beta-galactosidase [bacterium]
FSLLFVSHVSNGDSLLLNSGFNIWKGQNPEGWIHHTPQFSDSFKKEKDMKMSGSNSLRMEGIPENNWLVLLSTQIKPVKKPGKYAFGGHCASRVDSGKILIALREVDSNGKTVKYNRIWVEPNKNWSFYNETINSLDPNTVSIQMSLVLVSVSGVVWFDEMFISEGENQAYNLVKESTMEMHDKKYTLENTFELPCILKTEKFITETGKAKFEFKSEQAPMSNSFLSITAKNSQTKSYYSKKFTALIPGDTYRLTARVSALKNDTGMRAFTSVHFQDYDKNTLDKSFFKELKPGVIWETIDLNFTIPENACFVYLDTGVSGANEDDTLYIDDIKLEKTKSWDDIAVPFFWNAYWISVSDEDENVKGYTFYRKTFSIDSNDKVKHATLQFATNQSADLFVNGKKVGRSTSWRHSTTVDILKYLKPGKNLIAVSPFNTRAQSRVLLEVLFKTESGKEFTLISDGSWKKSKKEFKNWETLGFDDSSWENAHIYGKPPIGPYRYVTYTYLRKKKNIKVHSIDFPEDILQGKEYEVGIEISAEESLKDILPEIIVSKENSECYRAKVLFSPSLGSVKEKVNTTFSFTLPKFLQMGNYDLEIYHPAVAFTTPGNKPVFPVQFQILGNVKHKSKASNTFKLINNNFVQINEGEETLPLFANYMPLDIDETPRLKYIDDFIKSGINIFVMHFRRHNKKDLEKDLDRYVYSVLSKKPNAYILLSVWTDPPSSWIKNNPAERVVFSDNKPGNEFSFASLEYRKDVKAFLHRITSHINESPYNNRVLGYLLLGGEDAQWIHYSNYRMYLPDYSQRMKEYYWRWLEKKYHNIENLNKQWNIQFKNFNNINIPTKAEREQGDLGIFYDPQKSSNVIDYNKCYADCPIDAVMEFTKQVKKESGNSKLVGIYYFHAFGASFVQEFGIRSLKRLLESPDIDFLNAPNYHQRTPGMSDAFPGPVGSLRVHNKSHFKEEDLRTFLAKQDYMKIHTVFDSLSVIRRDMALAITKRTGIWWYDLHGGWFRNDAIQETLKVGKNMMEKTALKPEINNEIAVFIDEESLNYVNSDAEGLLRPLTSYDQKSYLGKIGAPYDCYLFSDIELVDISKYKLFIFLNTFYIDSQKRKFIKTKLANNGNTLLWLYAPGFINEKGFSKEEMSTLTGIKLDYTDKKMPLLINTNNYASPVLTEYNDKSFGTGKEFSPVVFSIDKDATNLGNLKSGQSGFVMKKMENYTSIFSAAPAIPCEILRNIAKYAGVHLYVDTCDPVYTTPDIIGIHASSEGVKEIKLKSKRDVYDPFKKEWIVRNSDTIRIEMERNETKLFELTPPM